MLRTAILGCLLVAALSGPVAAQIVPIDTAGSGSQSCPDVLAHPGGGYLVVYANNTFPNHPTVLGGVFAQRFSPSGERIGSRLALDTADSTYCLSAVPAGPGRLLVAWGVDSTGGFSEQVIHARYFDYEGKPLSARVRVGEGFKFLQPDAACDAEGRCWVAWIGPGVGSIKARRLDPSGQLLGEEIRIDSSPGPGAGHPERYSVELSTDPQGGFVAAWLAENTEQGTPEDPLPPPNGEIHLRRFSASGEPVGDEILLDPGSEFAYRGYSVCHSAGGGFFVAASRVRPDLVSSYEILLRRFDASGAPAGAERVTDVTEHPAGALELACGPDSMLLLWVSFAAQDPLFGRLFSLAGEPTGASFLVSARGGLAEAALLGSGRFLAAWDPYLEDPSGHDIFARAYQAETLPLSLHGGRFQIEATFRDPRTGATGTGASRALTADTGILWFFDAANVELVVKTLDGCGVNDHFWFFAAGLTDLEVEITVTDTVSGDQKSYRNPPRTAFLPIQDTRAFACP